MGVVCHEMGVIIKILRVLSAQLDVRPTQS